jgi:serine/threonine-protein kinase
MTPERWQRIKTLLQSALEREPVERAAFLNQECAGDISLQNEVESLIASYQQASGFMESPAFEVMADMLVDEPPESVVGRTLGHYQILDRLAAGGMGEIYLAEDTHLGRKVALKMLPRLFTKDKERVRRFQQEARAASALNHPNILTIYEIGQLDSRHFIATEFIAGETLRQHMAQTQLRVSDVLEIATQVASALAAAHEAGIAHRDIKPDNIMLRQDGLVKVVDFGLAKLTERKLAESEAQTLINTIQGMVVGTAHYMSPEQARGLRIDARTDIWSLGVVLYEMLSGRLPFAGETGSDVIASILSQEPSPLARDTTDLPIEMEWIVRKALRKDKAERYQTIQDMLVDLRSLKQDLEFKAKLERSVSPEPGGKAAAVAAGQPTSSAEYLVREIKSHKRSAAALLGLFVLAAVIGGYFLFFPRKAVAIDSIAVLPFDNENHDLDTEYLSDGLTESIINSLAQVPNLRVIARGSVFRYKGRSADPLAAGHELGVRSVLMGRLLQRGDNLTVSAELVDVGENKQLWGEQYERKVSDLLAVQREIASEISGSLRLKLSGTEQNRVTRNYTDNSEAYQAYLKGRFYWNKRTIEGLRKSIEYFNQATEKDPNYALAYTGLADCYALLGSHIDVGSLSPGEASPKAKAAAMKALEMDDTLAEAHNSLAYIRLDYDWDWPAAEKEFKRALELNPNSAAAHHWYSHYFMTMGRIEESLAESKRALELDPLGLIMNVHLGWHYMTARQFDLAIEQFRKSLEMDPNYGLAHWYLGLAYAQKGKYPEAEEEMRKAKELLTDNMAVEADTGYVYALSGKKDEALKVIDELKELSKRKYVSSYNVAMIYIGLKEKDRAFEWLENAYQERSDLLVYLKVEPRLDSLRSDPRFADLVRRVGLPP